MNIGLDLMENVILRTPTEFFLQHDGKMILASKIKTSFNNIINPENEEEWMMMRKTLVSLLRHNKAVLSSKYLLTPNDNLILNNEKTRKTIQKGGDLIENSNISNPAKRKRRRKSKQEEREAKRQKLIEDNKRKWEADVELQRKKRNIEEILRWAKYCVSSLS
jgi:hypothetical protein